MGARVVAVDIGSVGPPSKFAWAAFDAPVRDLVKDGTDPESAVSALVPGLLAGDQAALLLEAPMSVPVPGGQPGAWRGLGKARHGERNRPWSAGAGTGALATGLAQGAWMLRQIAATAPGLTVTTQAGDWQPTALTAATNPDCGMRRSWPADPSLSIKTSQIRGIAQRQSRSLAGVFISQRVRSRRYDRSLHSPVTVFAASRTGGCELAAASGRQAHAP
jgi:hypothetical protein